MLFIWLLLDALKTLIKFFFIPITPFFYNISFFFPSLNLLSSLQLQTFHTLTCFLHLSIFLLEYFIILKYILSSLSLRIPYFYIYYCILIPSYTTSMILLVYYIMHCYRVLVLPAFFMRPPLYSIIIFSYILFTFPHLSSLQL